MFDQENMFPRELTVIFLQQTHLFVNIHTKTNTHTHAKSGPSACALFCGAQSPAQGR